MQSDSGQPDASSIIRVVYIIDFLSYGGGMENQLAWLIKNLDRDRFSPHLVCLRPEKPSHAKDLGCPITRLGVFTLFSLRGVSALWRLYRLLRRNRTQILQIFSLDSNIIGVLAGWLAGVPNIIACRRDMGLWYDDGPLRVLNIINRRAHFCIANSEAVKQAVATREIFRLEQIKVIHNGIPEPPPPEQSPLARSDLGVPEGVPLIGIVANLRPVKRIDRMIEVLGLMKNRQAHLLICGTGVEEEKLKQQVELAGLADRVHFYHTIKRILEVMRLFTVGVLVSESEGLSNVLIEYALSAIPSVAFDTGGNREVIVENETGHLVPPYDKSLMASRIDRLLADPEHIEQMGRDAAAMARDRFSLSRMVETTQDYYVSILGQSGTADG